MPGKWLYVMGNKESTHTLLSTGAPLAQAVQWLSSPNYKNHTIHSMPLWSMASKSLQAKQVEEWDEVATLEDNLADGGFGSWLRESLESASHLMSRVSVRALNSRVCGMVGKQTTLNEAGGITDAWQVALET